MSITTEMTRTVSLFHSGIQVTFTGDHQLTLHLPDREVNLPRALGGELFLAWRDHRADREPIVLPDLGVTITFNDAGDATVTYDSTSVSLTGGFIGDLLEADLRDAHARVAENMVEGSRVAYIDYTLTATFGTIGSVEDGRAAIVFDNGVHATMTAGELIPAAHRLAARTAS